MLYGGSDTLRRFDSSYLLLLRSSLLLRTSFQLLSSFLHRPLLNSSLSSPHHSSVLVIAFLDFHLLTIASFKPTCPHHPNHPNIPRHSHDRIRSSTFSSPPPCSPFPFTSSSLPPYSSLISFPSPSTPRTTRCQAVPLRAVLLRAPYSIRRNQPGILNREL